MKQFISTLLVSLLIPIALSGCNGTENAASIYSETELQKVLCTTGMVGDLVKALVDENVEVTVLMQAGVDPHTYKITPQDVNKMNLADAVFYNGLHLEAGLASALENMEKTGEHVWAVTNGLTEEDGLIAVGGGQFDPHVWNDLEVWCRCVQNTATQLAAWNPENEADYRQRADVYCQELTELLERSKERISAIPASQRLLISAHDAFEYFGRSLELEVAAVQGISTNTEASVRKVEELILKVIEQEVPAIFAESSVNDKAIKAIIEGCQRKNYSLQMGGTLYSDAFGPPGSGAETFTTMFAQNVETICQALGSTSSDE